MIRLSPLRTLTSGLFGIALLLPASYFLLTLTARVTLGAKGPYYFIAPSFLQSPFNLFEWHKAQVILLSLILAIGCNLRYRRHWLNAAVAYQSTLLLILLLCYILIQHLRY
jgi:hypothetical protein